MAAGRPLLASPRSSAHLHLHRLSLTFSGCRARHSFKWEDLAVTRGGIMIMRDELPYTLLDTTRGRRIDARGPRPLEAGQPGSRWHTNVPNTLTQGRGLNPF